MESDSAPLYSESYSQPKVVTRHMDSAHADGIILANQSQPTNMQNIPIPTISMEMDMVIDSPWDDKKIKNGVTVVLGPDNTITVCQYCHASVRTSVRYTTTTRTHMTAALFGMMCCCCCIPYFINSTKNCDHYCPNCAKFLGTYKK